jgi:hypothetical protein
VAQKSIELELPFKQQEARAYFAAREALGIRGWASAEEVEAAIQQLLEGVE